MAERKPPTFLMAEKALCPHCGEKGGVRRGMSGVKQRYDCLLCRRRWYGEPPTPPERRCPYCEARCIKEGWRFVKGQKPRLTPLQQWMGDESEAKSSRVQIYRCTQCGRGNSELWPDTHPKPNGLKQRFGPCRFPTTILLDSRSEEALVAFCLRRKTSLNEGIRQILREASYAKMTTGGGVLGKPPTLPPDTPTPPLSNGRIAVNAKRRGKPFLYREVRIVRNFTVRLDAVSYLGLKRTMESQGMTRQEAARWLIVGTEPMLVGQ